MSNRYRGTRVRASIKSLFAALVVAASLLVFSTQGNASNPHLVTPTNVTISASPSSLVETQTMQLTATVTGSAGTPTGTVDIGLEDDTHFCTVTLVGGTGTCTTPPIEQPTSSLTLIGAYSGDSVYESKESLGNTTVSLTPVGTSIALTSGSWSQATRSMSLTATITFASPGSFDWAITAPLAFSDNGQVLPNCDAVGAYLSDVVTCNIRSMGVGTHTYLAVYAGNKYTLASQSPADTVSYTPNTTSVTGSTETPSPTLGQKIILTGGTFVSQADIDQLGQPGGDLSFSVGSLLLCSVVTNDGSGSCSTTLEPAGTDVVTVSYEDPTGVYLPSSSTFVLNVTGGNGSGGISSAVGIASMSDGGGYWITDKQGDVAAFGAAVDFGSLTGVGLNAPISHIVSTPDNHGYWLVAADGGTFSFGDAQFYGSMGGQHLNAPVVDMAPTADGRGYWLVGSDGGIFSFGDAQFYGSMGGKHLNSPVVGIVADKLTGGYWEVASDGGIFAFNAPFYGSTGGIHLNEPVNGMASTPDGRGYFFVASDGGIFAYGDAGFYGSEGGTKLAAPIVGMAPDWATGGYWLVGSDGGVFSFNAPFDGSH
jgi:hypothetical protein